MREQEISVGTGHSYRNVRGNDAEDSTVFTRKASQKTVMAAIKQQNLHERKRSTKVI